MIGRADDQINIRGYRVELGEVSTVLAAQEGVDSSVVLVEPDTSGGPSLTGHVVVSPGHALDAKSLRRRLATTVPPYMVPARLVFHDRMPLLPNGKIDRAALRDRSEHAASSQSVTSAAPAEAGESLVAGIFSDILGHPITDRTMSFVDMGADSLNSIQAMLRLERVIPALPEEWPDMSVAELGVRVQAGEPAPSGTWLEHVLHMLPLVRAELTVILRALAILAVVALHYGAGSIGGGATIILFMLAGYSMARFQLPQVLSDATARPILAPLMRIVAVTVPVVIAILVMKAASGEPFQPAGLLFVTNFIDFSDPQVSAGGTIWLWFIAAYVQILLVLSAMVSIPWARKVLSLKPGPSLLVLFLATAAIKYAVLAIADLALLSDGVPPLTPWNYLPTTHLPTVLLGMLVLMARTGRIDRMLCSVLVVLYAISVGLVFEHNRPDLFAICTLAVIWVGSIRIPRGPYIVALSVSQASLYLYLLHEPLSSALHLMGVTLPPFPGLLFAVVFAIGFTRVWENFLTRLGGRKGGQPSPSLG